MCSYNSYRCTLGGTSTDTFRKVKDYRQHLRVTNGRHMMINEQYIILQHNKHGNTRHKADEINSLGTLMTDL